MPSHSERQRRFLYHKFGSAWVHKHHFQHLKAGPKKSSPGRWAHLRKRAA